MITIIIVTYNIYYSLILYNIFKIQMLQNVTFGKNAVQPTTFGQPQTSAFGQQQIGQSSVFGTQNAIQNQQPQFGATQPGGFGQPTVAQPFGQPAQQSAFGQPGQQTTFGPPAQTTFGQPATNTFGQQPQSAFGQPAQQSAFGQPPQQTAFGKPATTFGTNSGFNTFNKPGAGTATNQKTLSLSEIGSEYLNSSAQFIAAQKLAQQNEQMTNQNNDMQLSKSLATDNSGRFKQSIGASQDVKNSESDYYKQAILRKINNKKSLQSSQITETIEVKVPEMKPQLVTVKKLSYENEFGRVELIDLVEVPEYFELSDYLQISLKSVALRSESLFLANKAALVTLFNVFPPDRSISDIEAYKQKVSDQTQLLGGKLRYYSPETGVWEFEVAELL